VLQPRQNTLESTTAEPLSRLADPGLFAIDSNGNLTTKTEGSDSWGYEWNANNELTRVTKNSIEQARFSYDPLGRRVEKVAGGVTMTYTFDGEDIVREVRGASTLKYAHGLDTDEPLVTEDGSGALMYHHADGLGSIVKRTSQAGTVAHEYRYDAWGNVEAGASEAGYSFTGREWDPETSLYYYRARYYNPTAGRFISEDPFGLAGGTNLYAYVLNQPTGIVDPAGLMPLGGGGAGKGVNVIVINKTRTWRCTIRCRENCQMGPLLTLTSQTWTLLKWTADLPEAGPVAAALQVYNYSTTATCFLQCSIFPGTMPGQ